MTTAIDVKDLFHIYSGRSGGVAAIRGLNFSVQAGQVCVVRGPNGSGKSTLTEILAGTIKPSAGSVITSGKLRRLRQFGNTVPELTLEEYIQIVTPNIDDVFVQWNLENYRHQSLASLSPGLQQIASAAAVLASRPAILLADEPAGALSRIEALDLYKRMTTHCRDHAVALVLVTHDKNAEQFADRIVRISDGRLGEEWTPSGVEKSIVDQHGWMRIPQSLGLEFPAHANVNLDDSRVVISGLNTAINESATPIHTQENDEVILSLSGMGNSLRDNQKSQSAIDLRRGEIAVVTASADVEKSAYLRALATQTSGIESTFTATGTIQLFSDPIALDLSVVEAGAESQWISRLGIDQFANRPMRTLSGGQLQKAQLALALTQARDILVLYEPTSALDEENRQLVCEILTSVNHLGFVIATHDDFLINVAQHVISLDD